MKSIKIAALACFLAAPAFADDVKLSRNDAAELSSILTSKNVTYTGSDVVEVVRLLNVLNAIANPPPPVPAATAEPKK